MPEVTPAGAPMPRAMLGYDGTDFYVVRTDAAGNLQVDVLASALPAGAATSANQATMITALQLIDNLIGALQTVASDRLIVRGEDQHFSIKGVLCDYRTAAISGANGHIQSNQVPDGEYWIVTNVVAYDATSPTTKVVFAVNHDGARYAFDGQAAAFGAGVEVCWRGQVYADSLDYVRATFTGGLAGDTMHIWTTGYRMTIEA